MLLSLLVSVVAGLLPFRSSAAQQVTLVWQASAGADIAGYNVYYGVASGQYTAKITVTNGTTATISGLLEGVTYYFVVTAFNSLGLESGPSNEVAYVVPSLRLAIRQIQSNGSRHACVVTSIGATPPRWAFQSSEDFKTWKTLLLGTNTPLNTTVVSYTPALYFRLQGQ